MQTTKEELQAKLTEKEIKKGSVFEDFTRKYALSKTLRFELKPVGKTRENMAKNLEYDDTLQTFLADQKIEDAYQILKPVFDKIHEEFITKSLESAKAKEINFSEYFNLYKKQKAEQDKDERKKLDKPIGDEEKRLRKEFEKPFEEYGKIFKQNINGVDEDNEETEEVEDEKKRGFRKLLKAKFVLDYLARKVENEKTNKVKIGTENFDKEVIKNALITFKGFSTYFSGFETNRLNYYVTKDEKATAVATRIVSDNLPKFVDNILDYEKYRNDYNKVFTKLKENGKDLKIKNSKWDGKDKETEFIPAYDIKTDKTSFEITNFVNCLSQSEIDAYNAKVANVNYLVNLYYQQTKTKLPKFKVLFKQIGCGEKKEFLKVIKDNKELKDVLTKAKVLGEEYFIDGKDKDTVKTFIDYFLSLNNFENIYWSDKAINTISGKYFGNWGDLKEKLLKEKVFNKDKNTGEAKIPQAVQLSDLFKVLDAEKDWREEGVLFRENFKENNEEKQNIINNAQTPHEALPKMICEDIKVLAKNFVDGADEILKIEEKDYQKDDNKEKIKAWLDNALFAGQILKYWKVKARYSVDSDFTDIFDNVKVSEVVEDYDVIRNYLTQKPQDNIRENKLKLNFENGSLLGGWPDGQEKVKGAVILQKEEKYYLGILKQRNIFDTSKKDNPIYQNTDNIYKRLFLINLSYKTLAGRGFVSEFGQKYSDMARTNQKEAIRSLKKIIKDRYVAKYPLLQKILDKEYGNDKKTFDSEIQEVLRDSYVCEFCPVNSKIINENIENGNIYLFEIKCNPNKIQWNYWKNILSENSPHQLAGQGKIFYRPAGLEKKVKKGYEGKSWVIKNKRYTEEKFLYHQATKRNYKSPSYSKITSLVNKSVAGNKNQLFLGIDRGEKHLAYYSLVNLKGEILEQDTLNLPFAKPIKTEKWFEDKNKSENDKDRWYKKEVECKDYNDLLDARASNRDMARKNWTTIGNIKDLKDGYISQIVRKIVDLAIYNGGRREKGFRETPAFIVLENLNIGFKRGRQKIEKSVYQKLELALAKKLNFLVGKNAKDGEISSVQNALQLTPPVANFSDIEKANQFGIMLYTRAAYTSQTDPLTGWRKTIYLKRGSKNYIKDQIIGNKKEKIEPAFSEIGFDGKDYYFIYKDKKIGKTWTLFSGHKGKKLDRFCSKNSKGVWAPEAQDVNGILDGVFDDKFNKKKSLLGQIKSGAEITDWESLRFAIDLIQQIRNSGLAECDNDFILSPVRDEKGNHFDSREVKNEKLPINGDANGAFNIARKGIIMNEHIKRGLKLFIRDEEWDAWLAGKEIWEKYIKQNMKDLKSFSRIRS